MIILVDFDRIPLSILGFDEGLGSESLLHSLKEMEKAYAKLHGSYATLCGGRMYAAMIDLTGAPYREIDLTSVENFEMMVDNSMWELLLSNDAMGYIQSAATLGEDNMSVGGDRHAEEGSSGLVGGHAYAILRVKETKCGVRLLEMRNPWGYGGMEWTRDWSDKSPLWTEELKVQTVFSCFMPFSIHFFDKK